MKPEIEPGHRLIRGTLLQNGNFLGDGVACLDPDGKGAFEMTTALLPLLPNAAYLLKDLDGHLWPLDSLSPSAKGDARHYDLTHSIEFGEISIQG